MFRTLLNTCIEKNRNSPPYYHKHSFSPLITKTWMSYECILVIMGVSDVVEITEGRFFSQKMEH